MVGLVAGADGLDRVNTNLGVRDREAGLGGGAEDCECSRRGVGVSWNATVGGQVRKRKAYCEVTNRSTFCSTFSSTVPFRAVPSGSVGSDERSAGKKGSLPSCDLGIQAFAPVVW